MYVYRTQSFHWLPLSLVSDSLTPVQQMTDVTLAPDDADSKVLDVVSVADIDAQERVDDSLVDILKLRYGQGFFG